MHSYTKDGRRFARPLLESLEDRTVPAVHLVRTGFSLSWILTPAAALEGTNPTTANGKSTGSVDFALTRPAAHALLVGGGPQSAFAGLVVTTSSANASQPDTYHAAFVLRARIRDAASGLAGILYFRGSLDGTLTAGDSSLTVTFQSPQPRKLTLGNHVYTVALPASLHAGTPDTQPAGFRALLGVSATPPALPGPSHLPAAHPEKAAFSLTWAISPAAVLEGTNSTTRNGKSTGSVDFALAGAAAYALDVGGRPRSESAGFVVTTSSADAAAPDVFDSAFTLRVRVKDAASGRAGIVYFQGNLHGTLTAGHSALTVNFSSPQSRKLTLGHHVYTVTLPAVLHPGAPGARPAVLHTSLQVSARRPQLA